MSIETLSDHAVPIVLSGVLGLQVWVVKTLLTLKIVLVGPNGDNGINSEVKAQRRFRHRAANAITNLLGRMHMADGQEYHDAMGDEA